MIQEAVDSSIMQNEGRPKKHLFFVGHPFFCKSTFHRIRCELGSEHTALPSSVK